MTDYLAPEQMARRDIDEQLEACGWVVQDYKSAAVAAAQGVATNDSVSRHCSRIPPSVSTGTPSRNAGAAVGKHRKSAKRAICSSQAA
ncbi:hypothetical protein [Candidatus Poriferisodalis sp.]|uniref:hypothetical protein n=1 Tax=Candidatus Poriferisodalis sp. TaxID=3101277 RepID=UPI003C6F883B